MTKLKRFSITFPTDADLDEELANFARLLLDEGIISIEEEDYGDQSCFELFGVFELPEE